jgi:hypothetical protein
MAQRAFVVMGLSDMRSLHPPSRFKAVEKMGRKCGPHAAPGLVDGGHGWDSVDEMLRPK